jgi:hypothetical protein
MRDVSPRTPNGCDESCRPAAGGCTCGQPHLRPRGLLRQLTEQARQPRFLASTWAKDRLVLGAAEVDEATKACAAMAVAMNARSAYCTSYFNPWVRRAVALDDAGMVELGAAVMHYVSFNTVAHGMMLEPPFEDIRAEDFKSGGRLV